MSHALRALTFVSFVLLTQARADDFPKPHNTQVPNGSLDPVSPQEALAGIKLPSGFKATLLAAEPEVRQPIAMAYDSKGRLFVAENYTYAEAKVGFDTKLRDRILIFEDTDHDGKFDKRTVFWDEGARVSSIEVGLGGVWVLSPPQLLFIPDANHDDRPDAKPVVVLDGWAYLSTHHTFANGLRWGPDGWLYGRQGIQETSRVGLPGTPDAKRTLVNGSIWRYHPLRKQFEVVCAGTTNPWGLDWDQNGQAFFINTVIGHLWHVVPGAHYVRMYGQDPQASLYGLIDQTADHLHWDTRDSWVVTRTAGVTDGTDKAGGGHAHTGLLIYQADNWPEPYRNELFTINLHGRRLNQDHIQTRGATYTATHRADFATWNDPWFRGIDLIQSPDGSVVVADWSDTGECHENDGVHRTSGRLYRIYHGQTKVSPIKDVAALTNLELVELQKDPNVWYSRQARKVLQERASHGTDLSDARKALLDLFTKSSDVPLRLRALWSLYVIGALNEPWLIERLSDPSEHVRTWTVRLLTDGTEPAPSSIAALIKLAEHEESGLVLTFLASSLQQLPEARRWDLASALVRHSSFKHDLIVPLMVWFGIEPIVKTHSAKAAALASGPEFGPLRRFIARRMAEDSEHPERLEPLVIVLSQSNDVLLQRDVLSGIADAHKQDRSAPAIPGWSRAVTGLAESKAPEVRTLAAELSVLFGDTAAIDRVTKLCKSPTASKQDRIEAIRTLVRFRPAATLEVLRSLLRDRDVAPEAIRGLATFGDSSITSLLLDRYEQLSPDARTEAIGVLASRPASSENLLKAIKQGKIERKDVPAFVVSQIRNYGNVPIPALVAEIWPISAKAKGRIGDLQKTLNDGRLPKASAERGRVVFQKTCAQCHKLFGEGGAVGPELTGAQRSDLGYLLENILDPNATLAPDYRMSVFALSDGRVLNGLGVERSDSAVTIQTPTERIVVRPQDIESERKSGVSLMPDGLLDTLDERQITDLIRYLQAPKPTP